MIRLTAVELEVRAAAGLALRRWRESRDQSRRELAALIGVSHESIERWESGYQAIPPARLEQLRALGYEPPAARRAA